MVRESREPRPTNEAGPHSIGLGGAMVFLEAYRELTARMRADETWSGRKWTLPRTFWSLLGFCSLAWTAIIVGIEHL